MKNKPFSRGLSYLMPQIEGRDSSEGVLELGQPESEWERAKGVLQNILRWEDDGGQTLELYPVRESLGKQGQNPVILKHSGTRE